MIIVRPLALLLHWDVGDTVYPDQRHMSLGAGKESSRLRLPCRMPPMFEKPAICPQYCRLIAI